MPRLAWKFAVGILTAPQAAADATPDYHSRIGPAAWEIEWKRKMEKETLG
jgi:hypothetical protein